MRIIHISCAAVYGGIETIIVSLARQRSLARGLDQEFAVSFDGRLADELEELGIDVRKLGEARLGRPWTVFRARRRLRALLQQGGYDAAICHGSRTLVILGPAVRRAGIPLVFWAHGAKPPHHWLGWLKKRVRPRLAICCSRYIQQKVEVLFGDLASTVIHAPLTLERVADPGDVRNAVRREMAVPPGCPVVVQAGRLVPLKGHEQLIDALAALSGGTDWRCWIIGGAQSKRERAYARELEARVAECGLQDRIRFLGQRNDVPRLLCGADIYCQPNRRPESFSIAFIEALQAGLPVITTGFGGALEAITEDCGVLVAPNAPSELELALRRALTEPAYRRSISSGSARRAMELCDPAARMADLETALSLLLRPGSEKSSASGRQTR